MSYATYSLILINPTIERLDCIVVGAVIQTLEYGWDVKVVTDVRKIQVINPTFSSEKLTETAAKIRIISRNAVDFNSLSEIFQSSRLGIIINNFRGVFSYSSDRDYARQIELIMNESVYTSPARANASPVSRRRNFVRRNLRNHFKERLLWSKKESDIDNHKVVEHFSISPEKGLVAEFALRNGVMHITETIDFEMQSLQGKRLLAQAKTLVLSECKRTFGFDTRRYVVAAGISREDSRQSINLLQDHIDEIFALESSNDMHRYVQLIESAAGLPNL